MNGRRGSYVARSFHVAPFLLGWCLAADVAPGATPSLADMVVRSETILSGTVDRARIEMDRRVHVPVVRVALRDIRVVKGPKLNRVLIAFWAPDIGEGSPRRNRPVLHAGERCIVITSEPLDAKRAGYMPITASNGRLFPVLYDPGRREYLVHDWARRPVTGVDRDRIAVVEAGAKDPGTRVSEKAFLRVLHELSP